MTTPVVICDDSGMARKQMARALPEDWDIEISYASGGEQCLDFVRQGKGEVLFLDLNMPGLDGYGVLQTIYEEELPSMVIVVSGDVQPEAKKRVKKLGAIDFIKKPTDQEQLTELLTSFGLYAPGRDQPPSAPAGTPAESRGDHAGKVTWMDALGEMSNIAMGQAGDLLARLLNVFVELPIPKVNTLEASELRMALSIADSKESWSGVCQGFIGSGIAGEALLLFSDSRVERMSQLLGHDPEEETNRHIEVLMDMSSILVGAFLNGLGNQLDINFGVSHPSVLGSHVMIDDLLEQNSHKWEKMLAIELNYSLENQDIQCDLLLLFAEDAIPALRGRLQYIME